MKIDEASLNRLENWGRWIRDSRACGKTSSTAFDLNTEENAAESRAPAVDVKDAMRVQAAWSRMRFSFEIERKAKVFVALIFAYPGASFEFYRTWMFRFYRLRLRQSEVEELREKSIRILLYRLDKLDKSESMTKLTG